MSKKQKFLECVAAAATTNNDESPTGGGNDTELLLHVAGLIPEDRIPHNVLNAAKVFLAFCNGVCKRPHQWMLAR